MKRSAPMLALFVCLLIPYRASAQIPVTDAANLVPNTLSAVQSVITAVQAVYIAINTALELVPVDAIIVAESFSGDMAILSEIMQDAQGLMRDISTIQALFDPNDIPRGRHAGPAMLQRCRDMDQAILDVRTYALKAQTLVRTLISATDHLQGLVDSIGAFVGGNQARQTITQVNATMGKQLQVITTQAASTQRQDTLTQMRKDVVLAMDREIAQYYWAPYLEGN